MRFVGSGEVEDVKLVVRTVVKRERERTGERENKMGHFITK